MRDRRQHGAAGGSVRLAVIACADTVGRSGRSGAISPAVVPGIFKFGFNLFDEGFCFFDTGSMPDRSDKAAALYRLFDTKNFSRTQVRNVVADIRHPGTLFMCYL